MNALRQSPQCYLLYHTQFSLMVGTYDTCCYTSCFLSPQENRNRHVVMIVIMRSMVQVFNLLLILSLTKLCVLPCRELVSHIAVRKSARNPCCQSQAQEYCSTTSHF